MRVASCWFVFITLKILATVILHTILQRSRVIDRLVFLICQQRRSIARAFRVKTACLYLVILIDDYFIIHLVVFFIIVIQIVLILILVICRIIKELFVSL